MPVQINMVMPRNCEVCDCLYRYLDMIAGFCPLIDRFVLFNDIREDEWPLMEVEE